MSEIVLPTFFLCGAPKSGTTSLYEYCAQHPSICMSRPKETQLFFKYYQKGIDWFTRECFGHYDGEFAIGEASVRNMMHKEVVAPRIKEHCRNPRLIFILRDPVERIWSHYRFEVNIGFLPPTADFSGLIRDETSEWRQEMIEMGMYHDQLSYYAELFPRNRMKVFLFRDLVEDAGEVMRRLFKFIGVDPTVEVDTETKHNSSDRLTNARLYRIIYRAWAPVKSFLPQRVLKNLFTLRSAVRGLFFQTKEKVDSPSMRREDRHYLKDLYTPENERLEEWLGRDVSHWT